MHLHQLKRREFIALLGGAATASWPLAVRAQQPERMRRIGVLMNSNETDLETKGYITAFVQGLRNLGWIEGQDMHLDIRWNEGDAAERTRALATELLRLSPDVILASTTPNLTALLRQGPAMPIVFMLVSDPLAQGFVSNLAQPGGNITGFAVYEFSIGGKWIDLLKQMTPTLARVAIMFNPDTSPPFWLSAFEAAAPALGVEVMAAPVHNPADIRRMVEKISSQPNAGLIVPTDTFLRVHRDLIVEQTARHRLPAMYFSRLFTAAGGLMSYDADSETQFKQAAVYVDRILRGAKPGNLPVQTPTKFNLVINVKTARALGIEVPMSLLLNADDYIE
jgi:putative tryptophan/tyrosine transport system substrate-binding protein